MQAATYMSFYREFRKCCTSWCCSFAHSHKVDEVNYDIVGTYIVHRYIGLFCRYLENGGETCEVSGVNLLLNLFVGQLCAGDFDVGHQLLLRLVPNNLAFGINIIHMLDCIYVYLCK